MKWVLLEYGDVAPAPDKMHFGSPCIPVEFNFSCHSLDLVGDRARLLHGLDIFAAHLRFFFHLIIGAPSLQWPISLVHSLRCMTFKISGPFISGSECRPVLAQQFCNFCS